jgi:hypothetical protein
MIPPTNLSRQYSSRRPFKWIDMTALYRFLLQIPFEEELDSPGNLNAGRTAFVGSSFASPAA